MPALPEKAGYFYSALLRCCHQQVSVGDSDNMEGGISVGMAALHSQLDWTKKHMRG